MADFRARFRSLDRIPAGHVWPAVERRVEALDRTGRLRPVVIRDAGGPTAPAGSWRGSAAIAAVLILGIIATVGVALLIGSWEERRLVVTPEPTTLPAALLDCRAAQIAADRSVDGWTTPLRRGSGTVQNGWIAVWGTAPLPEVILVHPSTGERCPLVRFADLTRPDREPQPDDGTRDWIPWRGALAWSPDGSALAIVALAEEPRVQELYVWSLDGLAGPFLQERETMFLEPPTWSPDGSQLSVVRGERTANPQRRPILSIIGADGAVTDHTVACDGCYAGQAVWSPDGRRLALQVRQNPTDPAADPGGVVIATLGDEVVDVLPSTSALATTFLVGWQDDNQVLFASTEQDRFLAMPVDDPDSLRELGRTGVGPFSGVLGLSPDRGRWAWVEFQSPAPQFDLFVATAGERDSVSVARVPEFTPIGWAPNSQSLAYLVDVRDADQGLWTVSIDGAEPRRLVAGDLAVAKEQFWPPAIAWQPIWTDAR